MSKLKQIKSKGSLADKAYDVIKHAILTLELKPGQVLLEDELSQQLGISRTPLRSALLKLSYENLVTISPSRGTNVTELSTKYILDVFVAREVIEMLSVKLAAQNRTEEDIHYMKELGEQQYIILKEKNLNIREYIEIDKKIHYSFAQASKNEIVREQVLRLMEGYNRYLLSVPFDHRANTVVNEHMRIIHEIEKGNPEKAQEIVKNHILDIKETLIAGINK